MPNEAAAVAQDLSLQELVLGFFAYAKKHEVSGILRFDHPEWAMFLYAFKKECPKLLQPCLNLEFDWNGPAPTIRDAQSVERAIYQYVNVTYGQHYVMIGDGPWGEKFITNFWLLARTMLLRAMKVEGFLHFEKK